MLRAVPVGALSSGRSRNQKVRDRRKRVPLARDGAILAKFFNAVAGRPYPSNGISLEQGIQAELVADLGLAYGLTTSTTVPVSAGFAVTISLFPGSARYLSLFDQYRIDQVEVWIQSTAAITTGFLGELASAVDLDDANPPATFSAAADKQGALVGSLLPGRYHCWKPHMALASYSGTFTSYSNITAGWIDAASPNVQHYGLKMVAGTTSVAVGVGIVVRVVASFRAPGIA
jgi:hypothetical protein